MKIIWHWNFLETIGVLIIGFFVFVAVVKILAGTWLYGKVKGWW